LTKLKIFNPLKFWVARSLTLALPEYLQASVTQIEVCNFRFLIVFFFLCTFIYLFIYFLLIFIIFISIFIILFSSSWSESFLYILNIFWVMIFLEISLQQYIQVPPVPSLPLSILSFNSNFFLTLLSHYQRSAATVLPTLWELRRWSLFFTTRVL
jgi:hypothetical protein